MKINDLPAYGVPKTADALDYQVKSTEEYLAAQDKGDQLGMLVAYAAGVIILRKDAVSGAEAIKRATRQSDAVNGAEKHLVDTEAGLTWVQSASIKQTGLAGRDDFVKFIAGGALKTDTADTKLNCWEAILVGAMYAKVIQSPNLLAKLYQTDQKEFDHRLTEALVSGAARPYQPDKAYGAPVRGDIVLFSGLDHVTIATGNRTKTDTEILSFWPAPALPLAKVKPGKPTTMQRTTIETIGAWLVTNAPDEKGEITFGAPNWAALDG
jgi:hypothetical protein